MRERERERERERGERMRQEEKTSDHSGVVTPSRLRDRSDSIFAIVNYKL